MMAEGRFASLPRSLHAHHSLSGGPAHSTGPTHSTGPAHPTGPAHSGSSSCSSRRLQASLASSMDLLSSRPGFPPSGSLGLLSAPPGPAPPSSYQPVSIHGTLPRRKRGAGLTPRGGDAYLGPSLLHPPLLHPPISSSSLGHSDDLRSYRVSPPSLDSRVPPPSLDSTLDYVKFSREQFILEGPSEKLRRELEEELKMNSEEPRSHAWYHGAIPRQVSEDLVQRDGDFLLRDSLSSPGCFVLTCQWRNAAQHFKISKKVVMLNEAYSRVEFRLERESFDSVPALIRFYVGNRKPVSQVVGAIIFQPINRSVPLRCLEEKYEVGGGRSLKRLSLNITNGHAHHHHNNNAHVHDHHVHNAHQGPHCMDNGTGPGQLRPKDRCGSQPASLNQVLERRRPLKAHQSESFLPLGSRAPPLQAEQHNLKSAVFRTGSEPTLSPNMSRRSGEALAGQPIRGSDSQLCPKPPPKPSKVPLIRPPCLQTPLPPPSADSAPPSRAAPPLDSSCREAPGSSWRPAASSAPPLPPAKPLKLHHHHHHLHPPLGSSSSSSSSSTASPSEAAPHPDDLTGHRDPSSLPTPPPLPPIPPPPPPPCSYVERLRREAEGRSRIRRESEEEGGERGLDRSSYHHAIAALENTSEEEEEEEEEQEETGREEEEEEQEEVKERSVFRRPVEEKESSFRPSEFRSRLLPPENKPLETNVLKKVKETLLRHKYQSIAKHLLLADCQVARIVGVTPEVKGQMGVASGLELVTLPHGHQLRLDLMERHHTLAIGVAVDILGCTGSVGERASTLNRIILVARELKEELKDLFSFTALMKALDLQQISRLEETWTTLRRNFTQTAVSYEKELKPFYQNLFLASAPSLPGVCVPLLLPLLSLMERPSPPCEGAELWESGDQSCDVMLRHLEEARGVARNAHTYTHNAHRALEGFQADEDLLEVFQTDFHLRLLWGSRGASVNQSDRFNKFNLILTALSRKLEPPTKTQTLI